RFRALMAVGFVLALGLAFLSHVRVNPSGSPHLAYRQDETWLTNATLFVTQPRFPWGRSIIARDAETAARKAKAAQNGVEFADPSRFSNLAVLYAHLATSDPVRAIMLKQGPLDGEIDAGAVLASDNSFAAPLPLIRITAIAKTAHLATALVVR